MASENNDRERVRDIIERLELQAFVADKIQSGMKPLIMDCLNEITNLRIENAKLREALKPFAYYASQIPEEVSNTASASGTVGDLRAAAAAIREIGDE